MLIKGIFFPEVHIDILRNSKKSFISILHIKHNIINIKRVTMI